MNNVLRTLVYKSQVSLTIANTTDIAKEGIRLHKLNVPMATMFAKVLSVMAYMSACLKNQQGEISLSIKSEGACQEIAFSGNQALQLRGYIVADKQENNLKLGNGSLTIIRDDGYNRPFVGSCALPASGDIDDAFEEYYRISEQLPTKIETTAVFSDTGELIFSGVAVLQPLPFADKETLKKVEKFDLYRLLSQMQDLEKTAKENFDIDEEVFDFRESIYKCNCSKAYLQEVLMSLGESQMRQIIKEDGGVHVHCHYCNTDYTFTDADADEMFKKK